jgi:hydroxypyruvate isomerase
VPFPERFRRAADSGFRAAEFMWPGVEQVDAVARAVADTGLEVALFSFDAGDMPAGERGLAGVPDRRSQFRDNVPVALVLAARIGCPRLNALVGLHQAGLERTAQLELARENVAWAAEQARAQGTTIMIEPVNRHDNGDVLLETLSEAIAFIDSVGADNVQSNTTCTTCSGWRGTWPRRSRALLPRIGHVQIADPPSPAEPGTGEVNFGFVLGLLDWSGYGGWVGLEYNPSTATTEESFAWMKELGYA